MKRLFKYTAGVVLALCLVLLSGYMIFQFSASETRKGWLIGLVHSLSGRELSISGEFQLDIGQDLSLVAGGMELANADWGSYPALWRVGRLESRVKLWPLLQGVLDLQVKLQEPQLFLETDEHGMRNWLFTAAESDDDGSYLLVRQVLADLEVKDAVFRFRNGQTGKADQAAIGLLGVTVRKEHIGLALDGRFNNLPLTMQSQLGSSTGPDVAKRLSVQGVLGRLDWEAEGDFIAETGGLDLEWSFTSPTLRIVDGELGSMLPDLGPARGHGRIVGELDALTLSDVDVRLESDSGKIELKGDVQDIRAMSGISASVSLATRTLPQLIKRINPEHELPLPKGVVARGRLAGDWGELSLINLEADLVDDGARAHVTGQIRDVKTLDGVELETKMQASTLADMSHYLGFELADLPTLGPLEASWRIHRDKGGLGLTGLRAQVRNDAQNLSLVGEIDDLLALRGVDLKLEGDVQDLAHTLTGFPVGVSGLGPVKVQANLKEKVRGSGQLFLGLSIKGDKLHYEGKGQLAHPESMWGRVFESQLTADRISDLGDLFGVELPPAGPLKARARLEIDDRRLILDGLNATVGNSDLSGNLNISLGEPGKAPVEAIEGSLASRMLDITQFLPGERRVSVKVIDHQDAGTERAAPPSAPGKKVFSPDPLPLEIIRSNRLDLEYSAQQLRTRYYDWDQLKANLTLRDGVFTVDRFQGQVGGQPARFKLVVDGSVSPLGIALDYDADNVNISKHTTSLGTALQGGEADMHIHLKGSGNTLAAIMASLNGTVSAGLKGGRIPNAAVNRMGESLLDQLNPLSARQGAFVSLECAAAYYVIKDGIAKTPRGMVAKLPNVTWMGNGEIDLRTERIQISMKPKARKGLGISFKQLAGLVLLGGTLGQPVVEIDPKGVVGASAVYTAAISTGGLSLLVTSVLDRAQANEDVCEQVMQRIGEKPRGLGAQDATQEKTGWEEDPLHDLTNH